jgi:protein-L-isoaspartate(D-aspartate) O-methyltransferase
MTGDDQRSAKLRTFYARYVTECAGTRDPRVEQAFAAVPREPFAGPVPWFIVAFSSPPRPDCSSYVQTPDGDPAFLYQDVLVALDRTRGINIGQPSLHARCLDALAIQEGETVLHVGTGSGYYTALLAHLVGDDGRVHAFEIDPELAERTRRNLAHLPQVVVQARSGVAEDLPEADLIYVSAGTAQPSWTWIGALRPGGRLLFPLQPKDGFGGMLLIQRPPLSAVGPAWPAHFVSRAGFIACQGTLEHENADRRLAAAFSDGRWEKVRSLRLDDAQPDTTCWFRGDGWWLSTAAPEDTSDGGNDPCQTFKPIRYKV